VATVVFFPEGAFGPTNNCVGIGDVLRRRGHRVVFIVEESFAGTLEARGFEERLMRLGPPPEVEEAPGAVLEGLHPRHGADVPQADDRAAGRVPRADLAGADRRCALREPAARGDHRRARARRHLRGQRARVPRRFRRRAGPGSGSSRAIRSRSATPPSRPSSPATAAGDRPGWDEFHAEHDRTHRPLWTEFNDFCQEAGAPPLPELEFIHASPYLNLYVYPEELDYRRSQPLDSTWHRLESCVRTSDASFEIPEGCATARAA
jgi:hypothetical protein